MKKEVLHMTCNTPFLSTVSGQQPMEINFSKLILKQHKP